MNKILVVDDENHICKLYEEVFRRDGFEVLTAQDTKLARRLLDEKPPDVIILDIELDEDSGLNFLKYCKANYGWIPVILNSAYSIYKSDFHSWAADAYIVKTSDLEPLIQKVNELINVTTGHEEKSVGD